MVTELQCNYTQRPDLNSQIMRSLNLSDLQRMALYVRALFFLSLSTLSFVDFDSVSILKQFWQYPIQIQYESVYRFATLCR